MQGFIDFDDFEAIFPDAFIEQIHVDEDSFPMTLYLTHTNPGQDMVMYFYTDRNVTITGSADGMSWNIDAKEGWNSVIMHQTGGSFSSFTSEVSGSDYKWFVSGSDSGDTEGDPAGPGDIDD
jgi:hypothetical protein